MLEGKKILGIIPARGGSKGLPQKNIKILCGKPLVEWSILRGLESEFIDLLIVSTDDSTIADIARAAGADVPHLRPSELATDTASTVDVVIDLLEKLQAAGEFFDILILLEPTSPLREKHDIDSMLTRLCDGWERFDSIMSIGKAATHPSLVKKTEGDYLLPYSSDVSCARRQELPDAWFPYGVAYIVKTDVLLSEKTFYSRRNTYYKIKPHQCIEIDDLSDFLCVEALMRHTWGV